MAKHILIDSILVFKVAHMLECVIYSFDAKLGLIQSNCVYPMRLFNSCCVFE